MPARPAPGSVWPAFAFRLPTASRAFVRSQRDKKIAAIALASMGSPRPVPVPCISNAASSSNASCESASDALSTPCWACPFGAVRLALRPSWRIALPSRRTGALSARRHATVSIASPRAYPSARVSNVCDAPVADVKAAMAFPSIARASISMFTPELSAAVHSCRWRARMLLWLPTSDDEQAVSKEAHGPCKPSVNDTRPHETEQAKPVDAYTLQAAGDVRSTLSNSLCH